MIENRSIDSDDAKARQNDANLSKTKFAHHDEMNAFLFFFFTLCLYILMAGQFASKKKQQQKTNV